MTRKLPVINKKLIDNDIHFRKLVENSYSGTTLFDRDLRVIYRSPSSEKINGWNDKNRGKKTIEDLTHPADWKKTAEVLQQVLKNPELSQTCSFRTRHFDGHFIWVAATYTNMLADPDVNAIVCNFIDITLQKEVEQHSKLLQSVITHTTDAVLITEAEPFDEPGNRILYVNEAFTTLTGYTADEVIGKTPRILQGPNTDKKELKRVSESIRKWHPCETTVLNYKKNGEEFWINFSLSPVADETGWYTHWISIDKDVTERKNDELKKTLLADISLLFNANLGLKSVLESALERLVNFGDFILAEIWLLATDKKRIKLTAKYTKTIEGVIFFTDTSQVRMFTPGESLCGIAWQTGLTQFWDHIGDRSEFSRFEAAKKSGLRSAYAIPLFNNDEVTGVLVLGLSTNKKSGALFNTLLEEISVNLGTQIKRKQVEDELSQVFNFAPDVICIAGTDGYFKKVNPALCNILGYTEQELLSKPLIAFIHPADQEKTTILFNNLSENRITFNFETRSLTKAGKIRWLIWTSTPASEDGLLFCVARDITEKKELEGLLNKATSMARIGGWEIDRVNNTLFWSPITKEIHEVAPDFEPDIETAVNFYKEGYDRDTIVQKITEVVETGKPTDIQLQIVTPTGKAKWVRVLGEAEFIDNQCVRIYGSFQDIDALKKAEITANKVLEEKNTILESIDDAFFAVDKNWVVTYWNTMAENLLGKPKKVMLHSNLWDIFPQLINGLSYKKYHEAVETQHAVHFEDFYEPLQKWTDISAYPSADGLSVFFKDITERKVSDMLLSESEKRYSELFHLSPLPKWVYDIHTLRFLDVNMAAIKNYGYSREEFLSMTIKDIRPSHEIPKLVETLNKSVNVGQLVVQGVFTHKKKNGEIIQVDIQSNRFQFKGIDAKVIIANDITERLNYIKAIESKNEKLLEVSWMQSHVIRAPLTRIMGLITLIKNASDHEKPLMMEYLETSANELDEVIKGISDITNT